MSRYRKVAVAIWSDEKVRGFNVDGKLAFVFVLTHPMMTSVGAMRATLSGLAAELGWPPRRLERALAPALQAKMIEVNGAAAYLCLPNFLKHNPPENPNVASAWGGVIRELVPECVERSALIRRCRDYLQASPKLLEAFDKGLAKAFTQPFAKGMAIQEQEQEQEREQEEASPLPPNSSLVGAKGNGHRRPARRQVDADWGRR